MKGIWDSMYKFFIIFCVVIIKTTHARDAFDVLGVSKHASTKEIKSAYKKLSLEHHPDKNKGSADKFIEISEAYENIKDEETRRRYKQDFQHQEYQRGFPRRGGRHRRHAEDIFAAFEEELNREFRGSFHSRGRFQQSGRTYFYSSGGHQDISLWTMLTTIVSTFFSQIMTAVATITIISLTYCCWIPDNKEYDELEAEDDEREAEDDELKKKKKKSKAKGNSADTIDGDEDGTYESEGLPVLESLNVQRGHIAVASLGAYSHDILQLTAKGFKNDSTLSFFQCGVVAFEDEDETDKDKDTDIEVTGSSRGLRFEGLAISNRGHVFIKLRCPSDEETVAGVTAAIERCLDGREHWEDNERLGLVD